MQSDFLIIGGGIIGLGMARALKSLNPKASIVLIDKEPDVAYHASGRNSGVLHAGFYYSADSFKARFCRQGNIAMHAYCEEHGLKINRCGKLVVARVPEEVEGLRELKQRGDINQVPVELVDEKQAAEIEPNALTCEMALHSPTTASVDPIEICRHMRSELEKTGVIMRMNHPYHSRLEGNKILAGEETFEAGMIINCSGLNASRIAQDFGFAQHYHILPFKGVYLKYMGKDRPVRTLLYSVPDMRKPFLGVHFAISVDGGIKIGPTAIPAYWRENYHGLQGFDPLEFINIAWWHAKLFATNAFDFRRMAVEEMRKYSKPYLIEHALRMVKDMDASQFTEWGRPGIRAQLLDTKTLALVQDFVVEGDGKSLHVLNANSPAFTSSLPFTEWVVKERIMASGN